MLVEAPPVDGFVPWIAVSITRERNAELELEARLHRRPEESLRSWDVRLDEESFYPAMLVPLTTVKAAFVEVVVVVFADRGELFEVVEFREAPTDWQDYWILRRR